MNPKYSKFARKGYDYTETAYDQLCQTMDILQILSRARSNAWNSHVEMLIRKLDTVLDEVASIERSLISHMNKEDRP